MILTSMMKFDLGQLVITPAALEAIPADDICNAINRHVCGDWGDLAAQNLRLERSDGRKICGEIALIKITVCKPRAIRKSDLKPKA